jgi:hypothetical protein
MGYDLHITRKKFWADEEGSPIKADEWLAYVATDLKLRLDPASKRHSVRFLDIQSQYPDPWIEWFDGDIYTKNPDEPILARMLQIASALGARVQGDDGEIYRSASFEDCYHED